MINIYNKYDKMELEWYDKDNGYQTKLIPKKYYLVKEKRNKRRPLIKKVTNIYTGQPAYIYESKNDAKLTVPYKLMSKSGYRWYDWRQKTKLQMFNDIKNVDKPHMIIYDIETTSLDPSDGIVTSIAWIDCFDNSEHTVLNEGSEYKMLNQFIKYLKDNKITSLVGFNSHDFDDKFVNYRLQQNNIYYSIIKSCNIDVMKGANKLFIFGSLMNMGKQLNIDREKLDLGNDNPIKLYEEGRYDELLYYNLQDVRATQDIFEKLNILDFYTALWELTWTDFNDLPFNSKINNCFANKMLWEKNLIIDRVMEQDLGKFGGGFNYIINNK